MKYITLLLIILPFLSLAQEDSSHYYFNKYVYYHRCWKSEAEKIDRTHGVSAITKVIEYTDSMRKYQELFERCLKRADTTSIKPNGLFTIKTIQTMNKTLILDYSLWRCGGVKGENILGEGPTLLNNDEGYMCCLGQVCLQLNSSLTRESIRGIGEPESLDPIVSPLNMMNEEGEYGSPKKANTNLSREAMIINDDAATTPQEKIDLLIPLFAKHGFDLEVVNMPDPIPSNERPFVEQTQHILQPA